MKSKQLLWIHNVVVLMLYHRKLGMFLSKSFWGSSLAFFDCTLDCLGQFCPFQTYFQCVFCNCLKLHLHSTFLKRLLEKIPEFHNFTVHRAVFENYRKSLIQHCQYLKIRSLWSSSVTRQVNMVENAKIIQVRHFE